MSARRVGADAGFLSAALLFLLAGPGVDAVLGQQCGGGGNRDYHFGGTLSVDNGSATVPLENVQIKIVRRGSPVKGIQSPDATTDENGEFQVHCTFARDRNGAAAPGGRKIRFEVRGRFRDSELKVRKGGWFKNNWFLIRRVRGCNRDNNPFASPCKDFRHNSIDETFETSTRAGQHGYLWWVYKTTVDSLQAHDVGDFNSRLLQSSQITVIYPDRHVWRSIGTVNASWFAHKIHIERADSTHRGTHLHELMHQWDVDHTQGSKALECLGDWPGHHAGPDDDEGAFGADYDWATRCSGFMEGFAEGVAEKLDQRIFGAGDPPLWSHPEMKSGSGPSFEITNLNEAERTDDGWQNFLTFLWRDDVWDGWSGASSSWCTPERVGVYEVLGAVNAASPRKARWFNSQANFDWFTNMLENRIDDVSTWDGHFYRLLGNPTLTADAIRAQMCHSVVVNSGGVSGRTSYTVTAADGIKQISGPVQGRRVTINSNDQVNGSSATGGVRNGADGFRVAGGAPIVELDNPGGAEVLYDGAVYHTVVIDSEGVSGGTGYTIDAPGEIQQIAGSLYGHSADVNPSDEVSGTTAKGDVGRGVDAYVVTGGDPSVNLNDPDGANVLIDGQPRLMFMKLQKQLRVPTTIEVPPDTGSARDARP